MWLYIFSCIHVCFVMCYVAHIPCVLCNVLCGSYPMCALQSVMWLISHVCFAICYVAHIPCVLCNVLCGSYDHIPCALAIPSDPHIFCVGTFLSMPHPCLLASYLEICSTLLPQHKEHQSYHHHQSFPLSSVCSLQLIPLLFLSPAPLLIPLLLLSPAPIY